MANCWRCKWVWMMNILLLLALSVAVCEGCLNVEREVLLKIKDDINYPNGYSLSNWEGHDCCQWAVITCDNSTGRVTELYLEGVREEQLGTWYPNASLFAQLEELSSLYLGSNQIGGWRMPQGLCKLVTLIELDLSYNNLDDDKVSTCLGNLTKLQGLSLRGNKLSGKFFTSTGLCKLVTLIDLDLSYNNLDDDKVSTCLGNLTKLQRLSLRGNKLSDKFFTSTGLCKLVTLIDLDLSYNNFDDDKVATCLGNLTKLQSLSLRGNKLSGKFFTSTGICELTALQTLDLSDNRLDDPNISICLANLTKLQELYIAGNDIRGNFFSSGLCKLVALEYLNLHDNNFDDHKLPTCLGNLTKLHWLELSGNNLSDNLLNSTGLCELRELSNLFLGNNSLSIIPPCIGNMDSLQWLSLSHNLLSGSIPPSVTNMSSLITIDLSHNYLKGNIPPSITNTTNLYYLDISENMIEGLLPSVLLVQLSYLNMSGNALQGITTFQSDNNEASNLIVLDLSSNEFSGELPIELFEKGVSLEYLSLSNNHLHFHTAPSFSNMTRLEVLLLDKNAFTEIKIFKGLANISSLQVLDIRENFLTGTLPSWLSRLSNLTSLLLGGNKFDGHIHAELCQMQQLRLLDFSYNDLSGDIPRCFNNISSWINRNTTGASTDNAFDYNLRATFTTKGMILTYEGTPLLLMIGIDFSSNKLIGKIPLEIGYLKEIKSLNLSHNLLTGDIPKTFQYLKNIESLDLSNNKLTGHIPMELTQLYSLSAFNVAFNNLSGVIPYSKGQFSTFNESIYEGNPNLCGHPLKRNCLPNPPAKSSVEQRKDESTVADNPLFFYSCVVIGYALGFWGCIALLYICKSWRMKLFSVVDRFF